MFISCLGEGEKKRGTTKYFWKRLRREIFSRNEGEGKERVPLGLLVRENDT